MVSRESRFKLWTAEKMTVSCPVFVDYCSSSNRMLLQASCSNTFRAFVDSGLPEKTFSADGKNIKCSPFRDAFFVFCIICRELCPFPVSSVWKHLIRIPECLNVLRTREQGASGTAPKPEKRFFVRTASLSLVKSVRQEYNILER